MYLFIFVYICIYSICNLEPHIQFKAIPSHIPVFDPYISPLCTLLRALPR